MRNFLAIALAMCISGAYAQMQYQKDPYVIPYVQNTHYKPDARVQQNLREQDVWQDFIAEHGKWSAEFNELSGMPHRAYGKGIETTGSTPEERAMNFITTQLSDFYPAVEQLVLNKVNTSKYHYVNFRQQYAGLDILWSEATFKISLEGKLIMFGLDLYNNISMSTVPSINGVSAGTYATEGIGVEIISTETLPGLKILPVKGAGESGVYEYKLVYEVLVHTKDAEKIPGKYYTVVDAHNGKIYFRQNQVHACGAPMMDASVTVSDDVSSNPLVATESLRLPYLRVDVDGDTYYTDASGNLDIPGLTEDTEAEVFLRGLYARVYQNGGAELPSFTTTISAGENALTFPATTNLSGISAYYYQNIVHDYMKAHWPDFDDLDVDQRINTDLDDICNAYYDGSSTNFFAAGGGCPNTALFSDVVMHEYGHGINYDLYYWLGLTPFGMTNSAMHEAYADLWAICNTHDPIVALGFSGGSSYIRRYDVEPKVYPFDLVGESHADGEIIAGAWWDLAENLGDDISAMADIWHETHNATIDGPNGDEGLIYRDVLLEALYADDDNADLGDGTPNDDAILEAFAEHGITLVANAIIDHEELAVALPDLEELIIEADLEVDFPAYLGDFNMHWRVNTATTWETALMVNITDDTYEGAIPVQPEGTIIEYYFEAKDIYGGTAAVDPKEVNAADPNLPYFLLVGYTLDHTEDYDNTFGDWVVDPFGTDEVDGSDGTSGVWDIGEPIEINDGAYINQTGVDHTPGTGNLCAFTGNADESAGIGYNDVDGGRTSLESPFFDATSLIDPVFTYYRWYANDAPTSANPGNDVWQVYISNNGTDYVYVERTGTSDNSWRRNAVRISDYVEPTDMVSVLFVAQDSILDPTEPDPIAAGGSLVEAAVDDMQVWGQGFTEDTSGNAVPEIESLIIGMFPNPTSDFVNIYFGNTNTEIELHVMNQLGEIIKSEIINAADAKQYVLDCTKFSAGIYTVNCKNKEGYLNKKLVITN